MLTSLFETLTKFFGSLLGMLPQSPFSFDSYVAGLRTYLPYVNWFIPFYHLAPIFAAFVTLFFGSVAVVVMVKFVSRKIGG